MSISLRVLYLDLHMQLYGMDFEALRKMCLGCPEDLWDLMVRCCQVSPFLPPSPSLCLPSFFSPFSPPLSLVVQSYKHYSQHSFVLSI